MAHRYGEIVARRVHADVGPDLDLDADEIEPAAAIAARAVARGTIEEPLARKASFLGADQALPDLPAALRCAAPAASDRLLGRRGHLRRTQVRLLVLLPRSFPLTAWPCG